MARQEGRNGGGGRNAPCCSVDQHNFEESFALFSSFVAIETKDAVEKATTKRCLKNTQCAASNSPSKIQSWELRSFLKKLLICIL